MRVNWSIPFALCTLPAAQVVYAAQYMTIEQAQRAAFAGAGEFVALPAPDAAVAATLGAPAGWAPRIFVARSGERRLGWLVVDQVIGKSELITYALALDNGGAVLSVEVLEYRESHGGEIRLPAWRKQFVGKTAADPVALNDDIRNISGATLSCRHLTEGVQRLLKLHASVLRNAAATTEP